MRSPTSTRRRRGRLCTKYAEVVHNPPRRPTAPRERHAAKVHDTNDTANPVGLGESRDHGQTTVKNGGFGRIDLLMITSHLRICGADDGNRTRVFSLGS